MSEINASEPNELFGFSLNTKDTLIALGDRLKQAMNYFSENKEEMLGRDKSECFEAGKRMRSIHDHAWIDYKRRADEHYSQKNDDWQRKQSAFKERVRENLRKNYEKLSAAEAALDRFMSHADKLRDDISEAYTDGFRDRAEGWLSETESKIDSIREQIERLNDWISEDEAKL